MFRARETALAPASTSRRPPRRARRPPRESLAGRRRRATTGSARTSDRRGTRRVVVALTRTSRRGAPAGAGDRSHSPMAVRASDLRAGSTLSSRSNTTASAPLASAEAKRSGRTPGTKRTDRRRRSIMKASSSILPGSTCYPSSWISGSSKSSVRLRRRDRSPVPATSFTFRSPRSAARSCCSRASWVNRSSSGKAVAPPRRAAGQTLIELGRRLLGDLTSTVGQIRDEHRELSGTVRIAGGMTVCLYVLPPLLKAFRRAHPGVEVKLITGRDAAPHPPAEDGPGRSGAADAADRRAVLCGRASAP